MLKKILFCMLTAGISVNLYAQLSEAPVTKYNKTNLIFDITNPSWLHHTFVINLSAGNKIKIEVADQQGLQYLSNIDSIIREVYEKLQLLPDSFKTEQNSRRIDFVCDKTAGMKMRIQDFAPVGQSYVFQKNELFQLKIEQDTIHIIGYYKSDKPVRWSKTPYYLSKPYRVTMLLNNLSGLAECLQLNLNAYVGKINLEWMEYRQAGKKDNWGTRLKATYNVLDSSKNTRLSNSLLGSKMKYLLPYISFGIQNMQNIFTPSLAAGMEYYYTRNNNKERHFLLYADNYFFFNNNPSAGKKILVNTFATFQLKNIYKQVNAGEEDPIKYNEQFSIGYLVNRNGTYLEKNSFRLGLPGFNYRNLQVLPGLFFNDFFKQVSPSLSLSVFFE